MLRQLMLYRRPRQPRVLDGGPGVQQLLGREPGSQDEGLRSFRQPVQVDDDRWQGHA